MGVYIKGMKKPEDCKSCPIALSIIVGCNAFIEDYRPERRIRDDCPLVEVKEPHGRLVDIDRVISVIAMHPDMKTSELREACTVIEAEGKESEL